MTEVLSNYFYLRTLFLTRTVFTSGEGRKGTDQANAFSSLNCHSSSTSGCGLAYRWMWVCLALK